MEFTPILRGGLIWDVSFKILNNINDNAKRKVRGQLLSPLVSAKTGWVKETLQSLVNLSSGFETWLIGKKTMTMRMRMTLTIHAMTRIRNVCHRGVKDWGNIQASFAHTLAPTATCDLPVEASRS